MKAIINHIKAITETTNQLLKGNFLLFFIPGVVISLIYYYLGYRLTSYSESASFLYDIPWIGEYIYTGVKGTFSAISFLIEQIYIFIILTVLSPVNTLLSEKVDVKLTGQKFEGGVIKFINDFIRMVFVVIIAISLQFIFIGFWWVISWMFGFELIYEVGAYVLAAFFFGFSFYDFSLERYNKGVFSSLGFAFSWFLTVAITGLIFKLIYEIPFAGIVIAPVLTTIISTIVYLYINKKLPASEEVAKSESNE